MEVVGDLMSFEPVGAVPKRILKIGRWSTSDEEESCYNIICSNTTVVSLPVYAFSDMFLLIYYVSALHQVLWFLDISSLLYEPIDSLYLCFIIFPAHSVP